MAPAARLTARQSPNPMPIHSHPSEPESSGEEDEDIPANRPSKYASPRKGFGLRLSLAHGNGSTLKRPHDDPRFIHIDPPLHQFKRLKTSHHGVNPLRNAQYPTPASSHNAYPVAGVISRAGSASLSTDDGLVSAARLHRVNATLHQSNSEAPAQIYNQPSPDSPSGQLLSEFGPQIEDHVEIKVDNQEDEEEEEEHEVDDQYNIKAQSTPPAGENIVDGEKDQKPDSQLTVAQTPPANVEIFDDGEEGYESHSDLRASEKSPKPISVTQLPQPSEPVKNEDEDGNQTSHNNAPAEPRGVPYRVVDEWEIPAPPEEPLPPEQPPAVRPSKPTRSQKGCDEAGHRQPSPERGEAPEIRPAPRRSQRNRPNADPLEPTTAPGPESTELEDGEEAELEGTDERGDQDDGYDEADEDMEEIDGLERDDQSVADIDLSVEESFARDVDVFRSRHASHEEYAEIFEGPADNDLTTVHLGHLTLRNTLKLMRHRAWAKKVGDWKWEPFNYDDPNTVPGQAIMVLLVKLERLYDEVPKAPRILQQNKFLTEHSDLLSHYFSQTKVVVDYIRTQRLASSQRSGSALNQDPQKRKEICLDLVDFVIPMLLHVVASIWSLGGNNWSRASFTSSTADLLSRAIGTTMLLYRPLLRELRKSPLEKEPETEYNAQEEKKMRKYNEKRKELEGHLKDLLEVVASAPDSLVKEERRNARELQDRRRRKAREKQGKDWLMSIREQNHRSLMSLRGITIPLESYQASSKSVPRAPSRPSPLPTSRHMTEWTLEEKIFLFRKIQDSYPRIPCLDQLRLELDKTLKDTEAMAEELLGTMLSNTYPDEADSDTAARVHKIMQAYRAAYGR